MKKVFLSMLLLSGVGSTAFAGGFQLNLQGLRQLAMGGTGAAHVWDASTIFYNPAGISQLEGFQAYASVVGVNPSMKYIQTPATSYSYEGVNKWFTPFNVYVGGPIKKDSKLGVGLSVNTPFGSGTEWPDDWAGRYLSRQIDLMSVFIQPSVSYKINEMFSVGGGFVYSFGNVKLRQAMPVQFQDGSDGEARLKGNANGMGYNLGLYVKPISSLEVGLTYRSQVKMSVKKGDAEFTVPASLSTAFPNTHFSASLPLPSVVSLGLSYELTANLRVQAEVNYVNWKAYDTLKFDYVDNTPQLEDTKAPRLYANRAAFRLGAHYQIGNKVEAMIGGAYDPSPVVDNYVSPELPDANRLVGSFGVGYKPLEKMSILAAVEFVTSQKREAWYAPGNFGGKYQSKAFNIGLGVSYNF